MGPNNLGPVDNTIMEANPDGTCPTSVLTGFEAAYLGLAWQPGPGRAVGRIAC